MNESCGYELVLDDEKIKENRIKTRKYLKNLTDIDRSPGWMSRERKTAGGQIVVPYKVIETDIFKFYFNSTANNYFEPGVARIAVQELEFDLS